MRKKIKIKADFSEALKGKKLPIISLDERWHTLFPESNKPTYIKEQEKNLNKLMKQQGKIISNMKDMKKVKNHLMDEIVANMDAQTSNQRNMKEKRLDKSQKLIKEINSKLKVDEDELAEIPYKIKESNEKLVIESMNICYKRLKTNSQEIKELEDSILKMREELKKRILLKQDLEETNTLIYSYMHDLLGSDVLETLDNIIKL